MFILNSRFIDLTNQRRVDIQDLRSFIPSNPTSTKPPDVEENQNLYNGLDSSRTGLRDLTDVISTSINKGLEDPHRRTNPWANDPLDDPAVLGEQIDLYEKEKNYRNRHPVDLGIGDGRRRPSPTINFSGTSSRDVYSNSRDADTLIDLIKRSAQFIHDFFVGNNQDTSKVNPSKQNQRGIPGTYDTPLVGPDGYLNSQHINQISINGGIGRPIYGPDGKIIGNTIPYRPQIEGVDVPVGYINPIGLGITPEQAEEYVRITQQNNFNDVFRPSNNHRPMPEEDKAYLIDYLMRTGHIPGEYTNSEGRRVVVKDPEELKRTLLREAGVSSNELKNIVKDGERQKRQNLIQQSPNFNKPYVDPYSEMDPETARDLMEYYKDLAYQAWRKGDKNEQEEWQAKIRRLENVLSQVPQNG